MTEEYLLTVEYKGNRYDVAGVSIEGVRKRAQSLYPGCKEIRIQTKAEWLKEVTTHERF